MIERRVLIERTALDLIENTAREAGFQHEVGGVLLGSYRGEHIHIVDATQPQAKDRFNPVRFWRAPFGHQGLAEEAWWRSRKTVTYVGEWHSHPEAKPTPSTIDRADWSRIVRQQRRDLVFLIRGFDQSHLEWADRLGHRLVLCEQLNDSAGRLYQV